MSTHSITILGAVAFFCGVHLGYTSPIATELVVMSLLLACMQGVFFFYEKRKHARTSYVTLTTLVVVFGLLVGIVRVQFEEEKIPYVCPRVCTIEGEILRAPEQQDMYQTFVVRVGGDVLPGVYEDVQVRTPLYPRFTIGETLSLTGTIVTPEMMFPHEGNVSFDYASYLRVHAIGSTIFFPKVSVLDEDTHSFTALLGRAKEDMVSHVSSYIASPEDALATGMLFGDNRMSKELLQSFRVAGLSHIIVLSGFNIVIIITFMFSLLRFLPLLLRVGISSITVLVFVIAVGGEASVIRATLMAFIALLATLLGREYVAKQALVVSLVLIVLYDPYALFHDVSLHLSFLATAGIVYLTTHIQDVIGKCVKYRAVTEMLATTIAAYISTLPYVVYTFGSVALYSLFANSIVVPLVPLAMLASFLVMISSYISATLAIGVGFIATHILTFIIFVADIVSRLPFSSIHIFISLSGMVCAYVVLFVSLFFYIQKNSETSRKTGEMIDDDSIYTY